MSDRIEKIDEDDEFYDDIDLGDRYLGDEDDDGLDPVFEIYDIGVSEVLSAIGDLWSAYISGDDDVRMRVDDASRRWGRFKDERPEVSKWFWRMTFPLLLLVYTLMIFVLSFSTGTLRGLINAPSFIGDLLFLNVIFIGFSVYGYFGVSKIVGDEVSGGTFGGAMLASKVYQFIIFGLISLLYSSLIGYEEQVVSWLVVANNFYTSVPGFPSFSLVGVGGNLIYFALLISFPYGTRYIRARSAMILAEKSEVDDPEKEKEEAKELEELITWVRREDEVVSREFDLSVEELISVPESLRKSFQGDYEEVERYWLRVPYSYACISYNEENSDYRYHTIEPKIETEEEKAILDQYRDNLSTALLRQDIGGEGLTKEEQIEEKSELLENLLKDISTRYNVTPDDKTYQKILYLIERNQVYYGKIDPLMNDQNIEDISCDGDDVPIFVFHKEYKDLMTDIRYRRDELRSFVVQLAQRSGEHISVANPLIKASMPDGSRAQLTLGNEVTDRGSTFTIRQFEDIPFTPIDLIKSGTFSARQMAYVWLAIENGKSLIFAGGTASGKTTSLNAISLFIPPKAKVVSIEDTREISLPHENWVPKMTRERFGREGNDIDMYELVKGALRQRPEYIVVGEIRGKEAQALFQAIDTGHTTYSTMHTDSVEGAFQRLQNPPINVPKEAIASLDIISIQTQVRVRNEETGEVENLRRNQKMSEIKSNKQNVGGEVRLNVEQDPMFVRNENDNILDAGLEDSEVLDSIRKNKGLSKEEINKQLDDREKVLNYLIENEIEDVRQVTRTIQVYSVDREKTVNKIEDGTFSPEDFNEITGVEFNEDKSSYEGFNRKTKSEETKKEIEGEVTSNDNIGESEEELKEEPGDKK